MNIDRINALLGNVEVSADDNYQGVILDPGFTCDGTVSSWVFGAKWEGNYQSFTELQIWRPAANIDGVFTKVWSTQIDILENQSELYYYPLSTPLAFQAGDVLGYYQPPSTQSQLSLLYERDVRGLQIGFYYYNQPNSPSTVDIRNGEIFRKYQMLIDVIAVSVSYNTVDLVYATCIIISLYEISCLL